MIGEYLDTEARYGLIHLWDLPQSIYIDLRTSFKQFLLSKCKETAKTWVNLGKGCGLKISKNGKCKPLESIIKDKKFRLETLYSLVKYLSKNDVNIGLEEIEKNIKLLASKTRGGSSAEFSNCILDPKLPFNFNTKFGAIALSALLHDGGINSNLKPHYSNTNIELRRKVYKAFLGVFGELVGNKSNPETKLQIYFPKVIGIILTHCLGMKSGRKTYNNPNVPNFIFNSKKEIISAFLQQAFDDEGWVHHTHIGLKLAVEIKEPSKEIISNLKKLSPIDHAPKILVDNMKMLYNLGIESKGPYCREIYFTKNGNCGSKWEILIWGRENLIRFTDLVNFSLVSNKTKLENILKSLPNIYPSDKVEFIILDACKKLQQKYGYITSRKLSEEIKRSQCRAKQTIRTLLKKNILEIKVNKHGTEAAKYIFTKDAFEEINL